MTKHVRELKIRLPEKMLQELKQHCDAEGVSVSDEVRRSIRLLLRRAAAGRSEASATIEELQAQVAELVEERFVDGVEIITRETARANGVSHYFTGKPCKYGHVAPRLVCNAACTECAKLRNQS